MNGWAWFFVAVGGCCAAISSVLFAYNIYRLGKPCDDAIKSHAWDECDEIFATSDRHQRWFLVLMLACAACVVIAGLVAP